MIRSPLIALILPLFFLLSCYEPLDLPEIFDPGFIGTAVPGPSPQVSPNAVESDFTFSSSMTIDHLGQFHAGLEAVYPQQAPLGMFNSSTTMVEIPEGYTKLEFSSAIFSLRGPGPAIHSAALFLVWFAPNEITWGQPILAPIVRSFTEPQNLAVPGFTAKTSGSARRAARTTPKKG